MKSRVFFAVVFLVGLLTGSASALAQPAGFDPAMFDPAMIQKRILEGYRTQLEIKDDAEWSIVEGRIQKVLEARRAATPRPGGMAGLGGMAAMFGAGAGGPRREGPAASG